MKKSIKKLRNLGKEQILKRLKMKNENLDLPNDMLTLFLKEQSNKDLKKCLKIFLFTRKSPMKKKY